MTFRIHMNHPSAGALGPVLDGVTQRPASWPTREAAEAQAKDWEEHRTWQSLRDTWSYGFKVIESHADERQAA